VAAVAAFGLAVIMLLFAGAPATGQAPKSGGWPLSRNYSRYCDDELSRLIDRQSQELDPARRLALVREIQRRLEDAAVRPVLDWRLDYYAVLAAREEPGAAPLHL